MKLIKKIKRLFFKPKSRGNGSFGIWVPMEDGSEIVSQVWVNGKYKGSETKRMINGEWITTNYPDHNISDGGPIYTFHYKDLQP